jgi:hypothetical protein
MKEEKIMKENMKRFVNENARDYFTEQNSAVQGLSSLVENEVILEFPDWFIEKANQSGFFYVMKDHVKDNLAYKNLGGTATVPAIKFGTIGFEAVPLVKIIYLWGSDLILEG